MLAVGVALGCDVGRQECRHARVFGLRLSAVRMALLRRPDARTLRVQAELPPRATRASFRPPALVAAGMANPAVRPVPSLT